MGILLVIPVDHVLHFASPNICCCFKLGIISKIPNMYNMHVNSFKCQILPAPLQTRKIQFQYVSYETVVLKRLVFHNSHWLLYYEDFIQKSTCHFQWFSSVLSCLGVNTKNKVENILV